MDRGGGSSGGSCYYSVLGLRKDAAFSDIKAAYRKLAMVCSNSCACAINRCVKSVRSSEFVLLLIFLVFVSFFPLLCAWRNGIRTNG